MPVQVKTQVFYSEPESSVNSTEWGSSSGLNNIAISTNFTADEMYVL